MSREHIFTLPTDVRAKTLDYHRHRILGVLEHDYQIGTFTPAERIGKRHRRIDRALAVRS